MFLIPENTSRGRMLARLVAGERAGGPNYPDRRRPRDAEIRPTGIIEGLTMPITTAPRYTAVQVLLLAADDLHAKGAAEFSEWELTVAAWERDRARFGMRGFLNLHPDHKRVSMEIMGRKPHNPILQGLMMRVRPNILKLTPLGRAEAARLRGGPVAKPTRREQPLPPSESDQRYDAVARYARHPVFLRWREDPEYPSGFALVGEFVGVEQKSAVAAALKDVERTVREAMGWCSKFNVAYLTKGPTSREAPIHYRDLSDLIDFLTALGHRFPQLRKAAS